MSGGEISRNSAGSGSGVYVGYGRATKEQVQSMVRIILELKGNLNLDTSDALAAAICHLNWSRFESRTRGNLG